MIIPVPMDVSPPVVGLHLPIGGCVKIKYKTDFQAKFQQDCFKRQVSYVNESEKNLGISFNQNQNNTF